MFTMALLALALAGDPLCIDPECNDGPAAGCLHTAFSVKSDGYTVGLGTGIPTGSVVGFNFGAFTWPECCPARIGHMVVIRPDGTDYVYHAPGDTEMFDYPPISLWHDVFVADPALAVPHPLNGKPVYDWSLVVGAADGLYPDHEGIWYCSDNPREQWEMRARWRLYVRTCPGDFDLSSVVDFMDLQSLISAWDSDSATHDLNEDGVVDSGDLLILMANYGECPPMDEGFEPGG